MVRPIPASSVAQVYRLATDVDRESARPALLGALLAFSDDLLESGDARLALDRAFRWGYREPDGERVAGLQERVQNLRHQRDRLLRQAEGPTFLEDLRPDLDRLDALDGDERADEAAGIDRLAGRIDHGYETPEARAEFDNLVSRLRAMTRRPAGGDGRVDRDRAEGASSLPSAPRPASSRVDQVRRMLFSGGTSWDGTAGGSFRQETGNRRSGLQDDIDVLMELDEVERALLQLGSIGGVMELAESELGKLGDTLDAETVSWLSDWADAVRALRSHRARAPSTGSSSLPPEVVTAIGRNLLKGLFAVAASPITGEHRSSIHGTAGDPAESSMSWEPGQPLDLDLIGTMTNAIRRGGSAERGRVDLHPDDFLVIERTARVAVSTVLAIDRSRSMGQGGAWQAAKRVALAMHELIRQSYPRDTLAIASFSSSAQPVTIDQLPEMAWDRFEHGTHLQDALALGRRLLRDSRASTRQLVVITDGEPTIATFGDEQVFASPPTTRILEQTMREVIRCTRERIVINMVLLGGGASVSTFAEQVARVNRGRVFVASNERLGSYLLRDYVMR
jgi:Mg-chelatase subunit ChlD